MSDACFRYPAVVEIAWVPLGDREPIDVTACYGTPLADRARAVVSRVGRAQWEVRDALGAVLEALGGLEREVHRLRSLDRLREGGVELHRELVHVGPDALVLQRGLGVADGTTLQVFLELELRDAPQLLILEAEAEGTTLVLRKVPREVHELLVAYTFQQELKERRRRA